MQLCPSKAFCALHIDFLDDFGEEDRHAVNLIFISFVPPHTTVLVREQNFLRLLISKTKIVYNLPPPQTRPQQFLTLATSRASYGQFPYTHTGFSSS